MMISADDQARVDAIEKALLARWPETRIAPTLERISALMDILGSPQLTYPTIHIAGTNGKTSTSRMIDSLLFATGMRTGRFTSPHLESYLERIAINGQSIDPKEIIFAYNDIAAYLDLMDEKFDNPISFFEAITALAFVAFAEHPIDVGVIEVGMGGTWDATNVIDADVSVVMPIDYDHMEYLGNTLAEIVSTKAGVIKEGGFVVLAEQQPEAAVELLRRAAEVGADIAREDGLAAAFPSSSARGDRHEAGPQVATPSEAGTRFGFLEGPVEKGRQGAPWDSLRDRVGSLQGGHEPWSS
jgi:dihydrofolate synthase/folylpolyglutamate synthase